MTKSNCHQSKKFDFLLLVYFMVSRKLKHDKILNMPEAPILLQELQTRLEEEEQRKKEFYNLRLIIGTLIKQKNRP